MNLASRFLYLRGIPSVIYCDVFNRVWATSLPTGLTYSNQSEVANGILCEEFLLCIECHLSGIRRL